MVASGDFRFYVVVRNMLEKKKPKNTIVFFGVPLVPFGVFAFGLLADKEN